MMKTLKAATLSIALLPFMWLTTGCEDASEFASATGDLTESVICLIFDNDNDPNLDGAC